VRDEQTGRAVPDGGGARALSRAEPRRGTAGTVKIEFHSTPPYRPLPDPRILGVTVTAFGFISEYATNAKNSDAMFPMADANDGHPTYKQVVDGTEARMAESARKYLIPASASRKNGELC
jgi:hypothetical protein